MSIWMGTLIPPGRACQRSEGFGPSIGLVVRTSFPKPEIFVRVTLAAMTSKPNM